MHTIETKARQYAVTVHSNTNHMYDSYLPYEYHLRQVVGVANRFIHLVEGDMKRRVIAACWLHDTIEDCRCTYNDVVNALRMEHTKIAIHTDPTAVAEIVRACTNVGRGRNRSERMTEECYSDIRTVPGALFVKLCDRIANIEYGILTNSSMVDMYRKEHNQFFEKLYTGVPSVTDCELEPMWMHIDNILR